MDNRLTAKHIVAALLEFDQVQNLMPSESLPEAWDDAASGSYEALPRKTLRYRQYDPSPLMLRPDYSGDFLQKLRKDLSNRTADNPWNIYDYSMPSEMLKHQEAPVPNDQVDLWYDIHRPGDQAGMDILRDWYQRSWGPSEAPLMSEDQLRRMRNLPKSLPLVRRVVESYLKESSEIDEETFLQKFGVDFDFDFMRSKTALLLSDLQKTQINTKGGYHDVDTSGVIATLRRAEPRQGRWIFTTSSGKGTTYKTIFQFITKGNIRDLTKLHVRVSCSCPAWLFYGAQYNAVMKLYLYGPVQPKYVLPKIRDPKNQFLVCKHVLKCIPIVSKYLLGAVPKEVQERLQKLPRFEVAKPKEEEPLHIPKELVHLRKVPRIRAITDTWDKLPVAKRRSIIMKMKDPDELAYFAHRFPATSTHFVAQRMKQLDTIGSQQVKKKAEEWIEAVETIAEEVPPVIEIKVPKELIRFDDDPGTQKLVEDWPGMKDYQKRKVIFNESDPDALAYLAYKLHEDRPTVTFVVERLSRMVRDKKLPEDVRATAEKWSRTII